MKYVKADKRPLAYGVATNHEGPYGLADPGRIAGDAGSNGDSPESQLIPRQQVSGEA